MKKPTPPRLRLAYSWSLNLSWISWKIRGIDALVTGHLQEIHEFLEQFLMLLQAHRFQALRLAVAGEGDHVAEEQQDLEAALLADRPLEELADQVGLQARRAAVAVFAGQAEIAAVKDRGHLAQANPVVRRKALQGGLELADQVVNGSGIFLAFVFNFRAQSVFIDSARVKSNFPIGRPLKIRIDGRSGHDLFHPPVPVDQAKDRRTIEPHAQQHYFLFDLVAPGGKDGSDTQIAVGQHFFFFHFMPHTYSCCKTRAKPAARDYY